MLATYRFSSTAVQQQQQQFVQHCHCHCHFHSSNIASRRSLSLAARKPCFVHMTAGAMVKIAVSVHETSSTIYKQTQAKTQEEIYQRTPQNTQEKMEHMPLPLQFDMPIHADVIPVTTLNQTPKRNQAEPNGKSGGDVVVHQVAIPKNDYDDLLVIGNTWISLATGSEQTIKQLIIKWAQDMTEAAYGKGKHDIDELVERWKKLRDNVATVLAALSME